MEFEKKPFKFFIVILTLGLIVHALVDSISLRSLFNLKAFEIIVAGIIISIIISFSFENLIYTIKTIKKSFKYEIDYYKDIYKIYNLSIKIKKSGNLSVQNEMEEESDIFMKNALSMIADSKTEEDIISIIDSDIESRKINLYIPYNVMKLIAHVSPAFGLIGTLIGLISLLSDLTNPALIMDSMAAALVSTLYGSMIANFLAVPLMNRIKNYIDKNMLRYRIIKEGIILLSKNDSPRNVFDKMNVMLEESNRLEYPNEPIFRIEERVENYYEEVQ
ncbi:MAG: MotA/TolQ/ExbB proton channel family protein [Peptostreptococcaceae bacterium]|jgi:chemotaxis protein MotA|nr:MotA/TolQ/ExbB proton channel family protein [Peptostreptococcaceae bacterium]